MALLKCYYRKATSGQASSRTTDAQFCRKQGRSANRDPHRWITILNPTSRFSGCQLAPPSLVYRA